MDEHLPLIVAEDDDLLVVNKPAGWNTHAPSPYAGEGVYDWLRHRQPRWAKLAIIHRLDKETSGLLVFGKTAEANRSLTQQFSSRSVHKRYRLLTDRPVKQSEFTVVSKLVRAGDKYVSRPLHGSAERAETHFRKISESAGRTILEAEPITGRTHQIRVHATDRGFPILGDTLYGGTAAERVCLHAEELIFQHPKSGQEMRFHAPAAFQTDPRLAFRSAFFDPAITNAFRLIHGAADGWPGWHLSRLGDFLLSQSESEPTQAQRERISTFAQQLHSRGVYHQVLTREARKTTVEEASPKLLLGDPAPPAFLVHEHGLKFELSFNEGYSVGLFLDQRDNRRRLLAQHVAANFPLALPTGAEVLNTFAYTCGFSVCAAKAGARTTSVDLSKKYLEWGKRNFILNNLDPAAHDFVYGDVFDWLKRWTKRGRQFDLIILDPPTFSHSRASGPFTADKDYGKLVSLSVPLLKPNGVIFAASNASRWQPEAFLDQIHSALREPNRKITQMHYVPQPPDFPITRDEPAYLKTVWLRIQ